MAGYVCPEGHPFPDLVAVTCDACGSSVACEPVAGGMRRADREQRMKLSGDALATALAVFLGPEHQLIKMWDEAKES